MTPTQTILITGSTAGIGREAALYLARAGHHVIATGRDVRLLGELREAAAGLRLDTVRLDVTDGASIAAAAVAVDGLTGGRGLDVLINNAGYGQPGPLEEVSDEALRRQFDTNVFGLMAVTRAFLPAMRRRGSGRILNVSSLGGRITFPLFGAYHGSKYALEAMSDALRVELRPFGVEVVLIEPGPVRSAFSDRAVAGVDRARGEESPYAVSYAEVERLQSFSAAQEVGPEEVARAMEHAITSRRPRARYVVPRRLGVMFSLLKLLPTRWLDGIMARFTGLAKAGRPRPAIAQAAEQQAA